MSQENSESALSSRSQAERAARRRKLLARDARTLALLASVVILLGVVAHYYFQSFALHRQEIADRWYQRGLQAMKTNNSEAAVEDFRSALTAETDHERYELALAEALAAAGRVDEARAYFLALKERKPGDGEINLELARLAVQKQDALAARDEYQQAIYGDWPGDGSVRRRDTRLELVRYLLEFKDLPSARAELLVAAGNASIDVHLRLTIAALLEQAQDPANALSEYEGILRMDRNNPGATLGVARAAAASNKPDVAREYATRFLELAHRERRPSQMDMAAANAILEKLDMDAERKREQQRMTEEQAHASAMAELRARRLVGRRR